MLKSSSIRPLWLTIGWCLVALIVWLSLKPPGDGPALINDKLAHLLAYFGLMLWFSKLYPRHLLVAMAILALGAALEVLQGWSGYRDMSFADLVADALGIGLGWFAASRTPDILPRLERRLS